MASALVDALGPDGRDVVRSAVSSRVAHGHGAPRAGPSTPGRYPRTMDRIETAEEIGLKRAFRWAVDWPGWCRAGRDGERALEAFVAAASRYARRRHRGGFRIPRGGRAW